jgi:hypothetical protein
MVEQCKMFAGSERRSTNSASEAGHMKDRLFAAVCAHHFVGGV